MPRYTLEIGNVAEPILATAIHAGHAMAPFLVDRMALTADQRLYEEDPYTDVWTYGFENRLVVDRSRFEMDFNRPRDKAIYLTPEDAWGLNLWDMPPSDSMVARLLSAYDEFYDELAQTVDTLTENGPLVVLDFHSYNHRRNGVTAPQMENPDVNIGTGTMADRGKWAHVIDAAIGVLRQAPVNEDLLDVRENVKFRGGNMAAWLHERYPEKVCVLSIEVKKIFMDELTGEPDEAIIDEVSTAFLAMRNAILDVLEESRPFGRESA